MKNWFIKYKLYHIPFWFVYGYIWWVVYTGQPISILHWMMAGPMAVKFGFYYILQTVVICFNLYWLIPRLLEKGRYMIYTLSVLALVFAATAAIVAGYYIGAALEHQTVREVYGNDFSYWRQYWNVTLPSTAAAMTLGMCIHLARNWIQAKKRQQALEKEKLETELTFLKNQFNPHFLFNTINSIFFLIHRNPDRASDALAKFSELLRYQLYECNDLQIPLASELRYLENFVELEKLRQNPNVSVDLELPQADGLTIAPFVLLTFVENACKHLSRHNDRPNWIRIRITLSGDDMDADIANSRSMGATTEVIHYGGIGLKNVRRRLDLIYPGRFHLDIREEADTFSVRLGLRLHNIHQSQMETA